VPDLETVSEFAAENPIEYEIPNANTSQSIIQRRRLRDQSNTPIAFPMGLGVITPDVSRIMEDLFVARTSNLAPLAEEGSAAT